MRSSNGGWHGLAGWGCFREFSEAGSGLWADDGANSLPIAGSSFAAADLCLAELRSISEISGSEGFFGVLGVEAGRTAVLGHGCAFEIDKTRGAARRRRCVPAALNAASGGLGGLPP